MDMRKKLDEFAELNGWDKNKLIGWSEAADFGTWVMENYHTFIEEDNVLSNNELRLKPIFDRLNSTATSKYEVVDNFDNVWMVGTKEECIDCLRNYEKSKNNTI